MITANCGPSGTGKSTLMIGRAYQAYLRGVPVWSNIPLYFPYNKLVYASQLEKIENAYIAADELWITLDARNASSAENKAMTHLMQQIRKNNVILEYTLQWFKQIDVRVRQNTNYMIMPEYVNRHSARYPLGYIVYDLAKRDRIGDFVVMKSGQKVDPRPLWELFNTKSKVKPLIYDL